MSDWIDPIAIVAQPSARQVNEAFSVIRNHLFCFTTILLILLFVPHAEARTEKYPWDLAGFGGAAALCDELGCFGQTGLAFRGSFGRQFTERWYFELEGTHVSTTESLAPPFDPRTALTIEWS